jgi:hypothetical protein
MFFQFSAPQGLKRMAAAIQRFEFSSICPFTAQITPLDLMGCHSGVLGHESVETRKLSDFIFY